MPWETSLHVDVERRYLDLCRDDPTTAGGSEVRLLFAFDPEREAVLLFPEQVGRWSSWYREAVPLADTRFEQNLEARRTQRRGAGRHENRRPREAR